MDEEIERLVVAVRADTAGFARDVQAMRGELDGGLGKGAERAGRTIETALLRAVRTGKLGFEDLKKVAMAAMAQIASGAIRAGLGTLFGGGVQGVAAAVLGGLPGRATGGPVAPGAAYRVGERGPELFVPTSSGRIEAQAPGGGAREVRVAITINAAGGGDAPQMLARSSRQVARAVRQALLAGE
ncbi:tail tape measure protein [Sphingomonas flavalba]|uniref:tail tape measure protein n=1 Tax=Sphingomonas flavalba TaxID=2559804 RepID=UPI0039E12827